MVCRLRLAPDVQHIPLPLAAVALDRAAGDVVIPAAFEPALERPDGRGRRRQQPLVLPAVFLRELGVHFEMGDEAGHGRLPKRPRAMLSDGRRGVC